MILSESRQKALTNAQTRFDSMGSNLQFLQARREIIDSLNFVDGVGQYHPEILQILHSRGQAPIVVNKVKSIVNQAAGMEINTRGNIAFKAQSDRENAEMLTKAMTHYGFAVQKDQHYGYKGSMRAKDVMSCGIGWTKTEQLKRRVIYNYVNPLNVIYDANDLSPQLENMTGVGQMRWFPPEQLKELYPKFSKQIDEMVSSSFVGYGNYSSEFFNRTDPLVPLTYNMGGNGANGNPIQVNELYHRERAKYYCALDQQGYYFETFDEEDAEKLAFKKSEIEEEWGSRIMRTVFCNDILFDYGPLKPTLPNQQEYPLVPCVWSRRTSDGVPVGLLEEVKDLQRELNYRKLKEIMSLNSVRARIDVNAVQGMSAEEIRAEISRPDGIIFTTGPGQVDIMPNLDISNAMIKAAERIDYEFQQVTGIYRDSLGDTSNADSGIAIRRRQIASAKNLATGFDSFQYVKQREGKLLMDIMQGGGINNILVNIVLDDDEKQEFIMNLVREEDGYVFNDIRTLPADIYVEITPDYDSSLEEQREMFMQVMANQQAPLLLQNPYLAKLIAGRDAKKLSEAMASLNQQQNQQQAAMKGGAPVPSPDEPDINPTEMGQL